MKIKHRYLVLVAFILFSCLIYLIGIGGYWYYLNDRELGWFDGFLVGLSWTMQVFEIGVVLLFLVPLLGILWAKQRNKPEYTKGFIYSEMLLCVVGILVFLLVK